MFPPLLRTLGHPGGAHAIGIPMDAFISIKTADEIYGRLLVKIVIISDQPISHQSSLDLGLALVSFCGFLWDLERSYMLLFGKLTVAIYSI